MRLRPLLSLLLLAQAATAQILVSGRVVDETGAAVAGARVELRSPELNVSASSDPAGNFQFSLSAPGEYAIRAERLGFFLFESKPRAFQASQELTITLNHLQEFSDRVDVVYSPPAIDPAQPSLHKE